MKRLVCSLLFCASAAAADTLLVLNKQDATLAFVDPQSLTVTAKIATGEGPHEVAVSGDGKIAVVCNYGTGPNPGSTLSVVDVAARKELRRVELPLLRPHGIVAAASRFWFTAEGSRAVARYDAAADRLDMISGTGQNVTHMIVVLPDEKKIYTSNIGSNSVSAIELTNAPRQTKLSQIAVVRSPEGLDLGNGELWVASAAPGGGISVIDAAAGSVKQTVAATAKMANRVRFTRDAKQVVVSDPGANALLVFDAATKELVRTIPTAAFPSGLLFTPDGKRLFVACSDAGKIQVFDTATWSVAGEIATGNAPDGMAYAIAAVPAAAAAEQPEFVRRARELVRSGKLEEALAVYLAELKTSPDSIAANNGAGVVLDLLGRTKEAKTYFNRAIELAPTPEAKANARRALAMSYAFDNDCANTAKYEEMAAEHWASVADHFREGEIFNEAARVCIEAGAFDTAEKLYRRGEEAGLKEPNISPARVALWKFRTEHALARLAARRNQPELAGKHVAAARALLDANPEMAKDQEIFYPYLTGYVALYRGDAKTALAELQKARQDDAFIQVLMAQAYEKLGDTEKAKELYRKAASTTAHNPVGAFARPFAVRMLRR